MSLEPVPPPRAAASGAKQPRASSGGGGAAADGQGAAAAAAAARRPHVWRQPPYLSRLAFDGAALVEAIRRGAGAVYAVGPRVLDLLPLAACC